jgi:hypothetical protein
VVRGTGFPVAASTNDPSSAKLAVSSTPNTVVKLCLSATCYKPSPYEPRILPRSVDLSFDWTTLDSVFDSVEEELASKEFEKFPRGILRYIWLEVEQINIWLVVDNTALRSWYKVEYLSKFERQIWHGQWICWMFGRWRLRDLSPWCFLQRILGLFCRLWSEEAIQRPRAFRHGGDCEDGKHVDGKDRGRSENACEPQIDCTSSSASFSRCPPKFQT